MCFKDCLKKILDNIYKCIPYVFSFFFAIAAFRFFYASLNVRMELDPDLMWHYLMGKDIVNNKTISFENPYSWIPGTQWNQQEWLFDAIYYMMNKSMGLFGTLLLYIISMVPVIYIGYKYNQVKYKLMYIFTVVITYSQIIINRINRPARLSSIFFPIFLLLLPITKLYVPIVFFLSGLFLSNFHAGQGMSMFLLTGFSGFVFFVYHCFNKDIIKHRKIIIFMFVDAFLFLLGFMLNPSGIHLFIDMFFVKGYESTKYIHEWKNIFQNPYYVIAGFFGINLIIIFCFIYNIKKSLFKLDYQFIRDISIYGFVLALSIYSMKFSIFLIMIIVTLEYRYIERTFEVIFSEDIKKNVLQVLKAVSFGFMTAFITYISVYLYTNGLDYEKYINKVIQEQYISKDMLDILKKQKNMHLIHGYHIGNMLMFNDIPVFVDTRHHPYVKENGVTDSCDIVKVYSLADDFSPEKEFAKFDYNYVLADTDFDISDKLIKTGHYQFIYKDKFGNQLYKYILK